MNLKHKVRTLKLNTKNKLKSKIAAVTFKTFKVNIKIKICKH